MPEMKYPAFYAGIMIYYFCVALSAASAAVLFRAKNKTGGEGSGGRDEGNSCKHNAEKNRGFDRKKVVRVTAVELITRVAERR